MERRTTWAPTYRIALAIFSLAILGWIGMIIVSPGADTNHAHASDAGTAVTGEHQHAGPPGAVGELIRAERESVRFCISASLEPFAGALSQIREIGGNEAGERLLRCLADTMFDHQGQEIVDELESHRDHFNLCFTALAEQEPSDKQAAVDQIQACVQDTV